MGQTACALFEERQGPPAFHGPREKVYQANYEDVWKAVNLVLQPYPLRVSNMDQGILETDVLRPGRVWILPFKTESQGAGETYKLTVRVIKGSKGGDSATKVTILKDRQLQSDFFSDPKPMASNGLEEKALLYRVEREIQVDRALIRAQKRTNSQ
ncbi:MAG: hypothetical protein KF799_15440 [Bdellovibrionales bacterium]|nr:hypothetical protein [Bdellovibrionales bacterium]